MLSSLLFSSSWQILFCSHREDGVPFWTHARVGLRESRSPHCGAWWGRSWTIDVVPPYLDLPREGARSRVVPEPSIVASVVLIVRRVCGGNEPPQFLKIPSLPDYDIITVFWVIEMTTARKCYRCNSCSGQKKIILNEAESELESQEEQYDNRLSTHPFAIWTSDNSTKLLPTR